MNKPAPIYLDYNATAPILPAAADAMQECLRKPFSNPASQHRSGQESRRQLDRARYQIVAALGGLDGCDELVLTSGATEANNLVLRGLGLGGDASGVAVSAVEHPSIHGPADYLAAQGVSVHHIGVDGDGQVREDELEQLLHRESLRLVSVQFANHETGVLQPVQRLARLCHQHGVLFHTDATQAVGKVDFRFNELEADALTFSAHKFQGPVGSGGCLLRGAKAEQCQPLIHGGFQQAAIRPGTESIMLAVGAATALDHWFDHGEQLRGQIAARRDEFERGLLDQFPEVCVHGVSSTRNVATSNVGFVGVDRQAMWLALDHAGVACSTGSACASGSSEPSPVLQAMGVSEEQIEGALRFSFGSSTSAAEVTTALHHISRIYNNLRSSKNRWKRA